MKCQETVDMLRYSWSIEIQLKHWDTVEILRYMYIKFGDIQKTIWFNDIVNHMSWWDTSERGPSQVPVWSHSVMMSFGCSSPHVSVEVTPTHPLPLYPFLFPQPLPQLPPLYLPVHSPNVFPPTPFLSLNFFTPFPVFSPSPWYMLCMINIRKFLR